MSIRRAKKTPPPPALEAVEIDVGELRRRFHAVRVARGLSQADLAALLGVSQATISSFEHGRFAYTRPDTLLAMEAFVREDSRAYGNGYAAGEARALRTVVRRSGKPECVWCGCRLPKMHQPVRFCPMCGGHQHPVVCSCGTPAFDARAKFCAACGKEIDPGPGSKQRD